MLMFSGTGMTFFDWGLLVLSGSASVLSFATYRSRSVDGNGVADHVRAIKAVAWAICTLFTVCTIWEYGDAPIGGVELVVLWLLAFSDIVASTARIDARLQVEKALSRVTAHLPPHR
jgi:hypothetical protein